MCVCTCVCSIYMYTVALNFTIHTLAMISIHTPLLSIYRHFLGRLSGHSRQDCPHALDHCRLLQLGRRVYIYICKYLYLYLYTYTYNIIVLCIRWP